MLSTSTADIGAAAFRNKAKLVWVQAFVLAHLLSTAKHKTEAKLFIECVMLQLLKTDNVMLLLSGTKPS